MSIVESPIKSAIKAIIFDCDGTLIDSEHSHYSSWREVVQAHDSDLSVEEYQQFIGLGSVYAAHIAQKCQGDAEALLARKREIYKVKTKDGVSPIHGTVQFLHHLASTQAEHGLKLAVASACFKKEIMHHLKFLKIDHFFELILSGESDLGDYNDPAGVNKPKPYIYLHAAKLLGVAPRECVVIEDTLTGVTAAVQAGCYTVAVPHAFSKHQDFSKAHLVIDSLSNLSLDQFLHILWQNVDLKN